MQRDSVLGTILVALAVCLVCATVVASAAVSLRPLQEKNAEIERKKNILIAAGLYEPGIDVEEAFEQVETRLVNLDEGEYVEGDAEIEAESYDPEIALKKDDTGKAIDKEADLAGIKRRADLAPLYLVKGADGEVELYVFPIKGKGLWSTMHGFLAVEKDLQTIAGITFYKQGETPGLGGEITNPNWTALWPGKKIYGPEGFESEDPLGNVEIAVIKGNAPPGDEYAVDGLSGATITSNGVTYTMQYWFGPDGFGPFIAKRTGGDAGAADQASVRRTSPASGG